MGLIIKDKLQKMIIGFPTVSDKYNVAGGVLAGASDVAFGDLVKFSSTTGYYEKAASLSAVTDVAGFVLGTNVKLAEGFPGSAVVTKPGEAFNLMMNGFIGAQLDAGASIADIAAVAAVGAASADTSVVAGKTYYTRASSSAGAGYLNDGTYAYTAVASPSGNPSTSSYYELSVLGSDAVTDNVTPNAKVYIILATGKLTTADKSSAGTIVELPGYVFTGVKELQGSAKVAEIFVK